MRTPLLTLFALLSAVFVLKAQYIPTGAGFAIYDSSSAGQQLKTVGPGPAPLNGNGSLGQIYNNSACGLNYVQASVMITTRYSPPGAGLPATFNISGIPCNSVIEQAYVWWTTSGSGTAATVTVTNPLGSPTVHPAAIVGSGAAKCWAEIGTYTYRASVTSSISGNGNYTLNISTGPSETDGATLFIIYRDLSATYRGSLVINDGVIVAIGTNTTQTISGFSACAASTTARAFLIAADLQNNVNANHTSTLNGTNSSFPNNFWNFDQIATSVSAGQSSSNFGISTSADCYAFAVAGLYYQTTSCVTCTPTSALSASSSQNNVTCAGGNNGSATVTPTGGTGPYTYSWSPSGGNSATATGLAAGTYTCTITDASGCLTTQTVVTITQPSAVAASQSQTNVSCFGGSNGSASVSPSGGTPGYSYSWAPSGGTGSSASGLSAGSYTCTITDANGCSTTRNFTITQPSALAASQSQNNVSCSGGSNGSATVSVSGGTAGYSYSWAPSGGSGATATGLSAGSYTCTITDANGCTAASTFNIIQPSPITVSMSSTNAACAASNGTATASPSGGSPGYSYLWSPSGQTTATATGLGAGTYTVTVTDANGCSTTSTATVNTPPNTLSVQSSQADVSCFGGSTGSATVNVSGGTPGYFYSWSPSGGTGATASGLAAGNYTCTITDAAGCVTQEFFVINQPSALSPNAIVMNVTCNSACDGAFVAQVSGGTGPYSYLWQPGGQTTGTVTGLCAGTYTMDITDGNGCTASNTFTINQPTPLAASITSVTQPTCGNQGSATVSASGGVGPYTYSWSPSGGTSDTATNLNPGTYTVTITDDNNCTTNATATINAPPTSMSIQSSQSDVTCNGAGNGSATASVTGGAGPYTYSWAPSGGNAATATNLTPGSYTVTVTDSLGCFTTAVYTIAEPAVLSGTFAVVDVNCAGACNGSATIQVSGGTGSPSVVWSNAATTLQITNICTGTYSVVVTDANGCQYTDSVFVSEPAPVTGSVLSVTDITCNGSSDGAASVSGSGGTGTLSYSWAPSGNTSSSASGLAGGTHTVTITDSIGCTAQLSIPINEPAALSLTITGNTTICNAGDSTLITANVTGGTAPYSYAWSNGNTNASQYVSVAGTYSVAVIDSNGCVSPQQSITINTVPPLVCGVSLGDSVCAGDSASVFATASGGSVPYLFSWSHGLGSSAGPITVMPSTTTTYTCTITDGCGSTYNGTVTVVVNPSPNAAFTATPDSSWTGEPILFVDGSLNATTWQWDFGDGDTSSQQNPVHQYQDPGEYTITLITSNVYGCYDTLTYTYIHILEGLEIPNVFTPNGDGVNDVFSVLASGAEEFTIEIFNRWGMKVFETTAPRIHWDGRTTSGQDASTGTYYYVLYAKMKSGKVYDTSGHVTLLR